MTQDRPFEPRSFLEISGYMIIEPECFSSSLTHFLRPLPIQCSPAEVRLLRVCIQRQPPRSQPSLELRGKALLLLVSDGFEMLIRSPEVF